jgi:hypothetical protein
LEQLSALQVLRNISKLDSHSQSSTFNLSVLSLGHHSKVLMAVKLESPDRSAKQKNRSEVPTPEARNFNLKFFRMLLPKFAKCSV